jgi:hypothetical protein
MNSSKENPIIIHFSKTGVIKLKPGPREGKDAMISDLEPFKNFGDHPFFEATFISEPVLTVMRTNRSLIRFDFDSNSLPAGAQIKKVILTLYNVRSHSSQIYRSRQPCKQCGTMVRCSTAKDH